MENVSGIVSLLKQERDKVEKQLAGLNAALSAFVAAYGGHTNGNRRTMSAVARRKISLAQKARWEKQKSNGTAKRTISEAGKKRIAAAQRARWAKIKTKSRKPTPYAKAA